MTLWAHSLLTTGVRSPKPLTGAVARLEGFVERTPVVNKLCAHNVILAAKPA